MTSTACEIRPMTAADADGLRALYGRVFGREPSREEWAWKFEQDPDGSFGMMALVEGRVVGSYAGWGAGFLLDGQPALLYSVGDVATDPGVRGLGGRRGIYRTMAERFYEAIAGRVPFCFGFPNPRALVVSHRLVGSRTLFPIRQVLVDCDALAGAPGAARAGDSVGPAFDGLWAAASRYLRYAPVRDRARVNWRFHARPDRYYRMVWLEERGAIQGWAVLSVDGGNALVADFLGRDAEGKDLPALFSAAAAEARRMGARRLVFWDSPGGPARSWLARAPGDRVDAGYPLIVRVLDEEPVARFAAGLHLVPSMYDLV
jgi:hypothetical protein